MDRSARPDPPRPAPAGECGGGTAGADDTTGVGSRTADGTPHPVDPTGRATFFMTGQTILWREWCPTRRGRTPELVRPVTVVRDDQAGLVGWLAPGTPVMRAVLADGSEFRNTPLHERYRRGRASARDVWRGRGILMIAPRGVPWSVWLFRDDQWRTLAWYVNLEDVHRRDAHGVITRDHELDAVISPDGAAELKDEDELAASVAAGRFTAAEADQFYRDADEAVVAVRSSILGAGWETWRPPAAWPVPTLPEEFTG